ncbi:MAG: Branched-chain alpha-keto acid dehydrogenase, E1 component, beta subunit [uncultured Acidimicrobiales bacterium]|uniref:dihydrolipoyllysine-residue succinyltransferase n=1 Tax=uncultured Acidimicrobiales bacterium TaxID=310071 RepID=A0A6J4IFY8_9ACTN|nr:MAG: Branched-chain alpha-keto acid dehydrogenase, E1 component, beta subunit [uncultured Acidimicrobiales bacterium]
MARVIHERAAARAVPPARHRQLGLSDDDVIGMYRTVLLARFVDQKAWSLTRTGKARFYIPGEGQEAAQVGSAWALRAGHDVALPYYRDVGVVLTLGMTPYEILLAVLAKGDDPNSGGRQMPNHWGSKRLGIITGSSPIGTQFPHAAGLALASNLRGDDKVTVTWFGEAAASKGDFHEALNFAGIHRLPAVFVCENNGYAISVGMRKQSAVPDVADRAASYGFDGVVVDGNDILDVYAATLAAVARARTGKGPTLVEAQTYRLMPHTTDDDDSVYRSREEVKAARRRDPVPRLKRYVLDQRLLSGQEAVLLEQAALEEVAEAGRQAELADPPRPATASTRVYASPLRSRPRPASPVPPAEGVERNVLDTVRQTLHDLMAEDERVMVLGEDVGLLGGVFRATQGLQGAFGAGRALDTPLAESSIVGIAIGLALAGLRPVAEIQFADFMHSTFDQMVSEAAKIHYRSNGDFSVPLVVRTPWGGGGHRGPYHSQAIESFYAHVAGLKVVVPSTPADIAGMLRSAVEDPDPVLFLEHKKTYRKITGLVPHGAWRVPIGVADVARPGDDMTIITYGLHRHLSLEAAEILATEDYSVEVIDLRTISPLDTDTFVGSAVRTGRVLVVHEDNVSFGVGAEVAATVAQEAFYDLDAPVRRLAMPDVPAMPYEIGLERALSVTTTDIVTAARALLEE